MAKNTQVQLPESTQRLTTICTYSSRRCDALFRRFMALRASVTYAYMQTDYSHT